MSFTANVCRDFHSICKSDPGDFSKSRVRLLRGDRLYLKANTSLLWTSIAASHSVRQRVVDETKSWRFGFSTCALSRFAHELVRCRHYPALIRFPASRLLKWSDTMIKREYPLSPHPVRNKRQTRSIRIPDGLSQRKETSLGATTVILTRLRFDKSPQVVLTL